MWSSESNSCGNSVDSISLIWWRTASAECAVRPWEKAIGGGEEILQFEYTTWRSIYVDVIRLAVDACILIAAGTPLRLSGCKWQRRVSGKRPADGLCQPLL